jgi:hypothetical protein
MDFSSAGRWEWAIAELIILPLLFWELYRLRRSQRLDREAAAREAALAEAAQPEAVMAERAPEPNAAGGQPGTGR